jgi:transcriptional regulator with XRE-family HTH domain
MKDEAMAVQEKRYAHAAQCGERVFALRKACGLTQEALGRRAGFSSQLIGFVEKGEINTPIETLGRIAAALGVPLQMVVGDADAFQREEVVVTHCTRLATHLRAALAEVDALAPGVAALCP